MRKLADKVTKYEPAKAAEDMDPSEAERVRHYVATCAAGASARWLLRLPRVCAGLRHLRRLCGPCQPTCWVRMFVGVCASQPHSGPPLACRQAKLLLLEADEDVVQHVGLGGLKLIGLVLRSPTAAFKLVAGRAEGLEA